MDKLLSYLNALPKGERCHFCAACGTTEGYLRKACSVGQTISSDLCIRIERESKRALICEDMRPDVDWAFIRAGTAASNASNSQSQGFAAPHQGLGQGGSQL